MFSRNRFSLAFSQSRNNLQPSLSMAVCLFFVVVVVFRCGQETRVIPRILQLRSHWLKSEKESLRLEEAGITKEVCMFPPANFHAVCSQRSSSISWQWLVDKMRFVSMFQWLVRSTAISDIVDLILLMATRFGITISLLFFRLIFFMAFLFFLFSFRRCWTVPSHNFVWKLSLSTVMQLNGYATKIRSHWKWAPMWLNCFQM